MTSEINATRLAVHAEGLSKTYQLGERLRLGGGITRRLRGQPLHQRPLEALSDVNLQIYAGECFGLVGTNGSGKSTFLQILSRTVLPTRGRLTVRGRVLPMLSVGAGFHGELTGRENVVLQGAILGVPRMTVLARMNSIMSFAELEMHADTPLKRYSNGMQSRLSFAIGMCFPADIYIFDEVLAVVDGAFRDKCLRGIEQTIGTGPTVIFVSHDLDQVSRLCHRAAWLEKGQLRSVGDVDPVLEAYRSYADAQDSERWSLR